MIARNQDADSLLARMNKSPRREQPIVSESMTDVKSNVPRIFLVVVDDSEEMHKALLFASLRAKRTGGKVAMLYVQQPADFQHWLGVGEIMREEAREEGEVLMQELSSEAHRLSDSFPIVYIREGDTAEELFALLEEEKSISVVVLAASPDSQGADPIIASITGKRKSEVRVPFTIVPGNLSDEEVRAIS